MRATNKGEPDVPEKGQPKSAALPNCYTPAETMKKAQQEKFCRNEVIKISGEDLLNESQLVRFRQETSHLASILHPDVVNGIVTRIFSPVVIIMVSNACNDLPIRGKFFLHLDERGRAYLD